MLPFIQSTIDKFGKDKTRLMDILIDIQSTLGFISNDALDLIAYELNIPRVEVVQTASFYHFFTNEPTGKFRIYLNDSAVANMMGRQDIKEAFEKEVGCKFGEVSPDGLIGLFDTACIGMNDQEPAALINDIVFTKLTPFRVKELIRDIRSGKTIRDLFVESFGDSQNATEQIKSMVYNNIRKKGPILEDGYTNGEAIKKMVTMSAEEVITEIKESGIRGRGGAGFPTGLKWEFCRKAAGDKRYIFCNADEGEPGTFKDRVILTEKPRLIFEGMTLAAYAVGASEGILYLRYEYKYLERYLEGILEELRTNNYLGNNIGGKSGFHFDIRIQFGGGAYVCGEESALIESAEGKRGEPRDRPPFPVTSGYLQKPTVVNNVETLASAVKVILNGAAWYKEFGTKDSSGTKLLSVSGDCMHPGIYEVEWGFTINDILAMVGATNVQAVQVGGPSGSCIGADEFDRILCYNDLATGGSMIVIGQHRDLLKDIVLNFTEFFVEESCGSCVPCRAMTVQYKNRLEKIMRGNGTQKDLDEMESWAGVMKLNRCGLGHTAANPILSTIKNFPHLYKKLLVDADYVSEFNLEDAVSESCRTANRKPQLEGEHHE